MMAEPFSTQTVEAPVKRQQLCVGTIFAESSHHFQNILGRERKLGYSIPLKVKKSYSLDSSLRVTGCRNQRVEEFSQIQVGNKRSLHTHRGATSALGMKLGNEEVGRDGNGSCHWLKIPEAR